jgi:stage III sporulation protein AE
MKYIRLALSLVMLAVSVGLFVQPAWAVSVAEEQWAALETGTLEEAAGEENGELTLSLDLDLGEGLKSLWQKAQNYLGTVVKSTLRTGVLLLLTTLLCGVLDIGQGALGNKQLDLTTLAGTAAILALAMTDVSSLATLGRETMEEMESFSKVLLPTMTTAAVASGSITSAAVRQSATMLFSDVLLTLMNQLLMPLVYLYTVVCAGYGAVGNPGLQRISALLKWAVTTALTLVLTAYVTWLSASSAIAGAADALAAKTTRAAISGMIPVVGGILSSASETVVAGAGLVKNAIGIYGLLATLGICLLPFLQLGAHYLVYKVTAALAATLSGGRLAGLIGDIGTAFGLILGMTGAGALVLLVSMVAGIVAVVG